MERTHSQEQHAPDYQRIISVGSQIHPQRASPCPHHFQDSTAARTVLATILEILSASGHDLSSAYPDRKQCPMLKCFHESATPMEQINHVTICTEASRGEIQCWTCKRCHDFKRWHTVCNTLKSPVELLRRLSNRKRGNNPSTSESFANKKGKVTPSDEIQVSSQHESHELESAWLEMEANFLLPEFASTPVCAQSEVAAGVNNFKMPSEMGDSSAVRPLPTPPSSRDHSWSENSQNLVAYGDIKAPHSAGQPPPYMVSPQTTIDDYQRPDARTNSLSLGIPSAPYLQRPHLMESPEDLDVPESDQAPWDDHLLPHDSEDSQVNQRLVPTVLDATVTDQYGGSSERPAPVFATSFTSSRAPNPHKQKQNTWPTQLHRSNDISRFAPASQIAVTHDRHLRQVMDGVSGLTEQTGLAATAHQQGAEMEHTVTRQASFDAGPQDSITVNTASRRPQPSRTAQDERSAPVKRSSEGQGAAQSQHETCDVCGQQFGGIAKNRRQHLKRHKESKHGEVRFSCGHAGCTCSYNRVDNLHEHEKKRHGFVLQPGGTNTAGGAVGLGAAEGGQAVGSGGSDTAEPAGHAAGVHGAGQYRGHAMTRSSSTDTCQQARSAIEMHISAFGYSISSEDWDTIMAGVSGGRHIEVDSSPDGTPEDGLSMCLGLAPRPLDLPCVPWRELGG
ncbi:hypothetical protein diail_6272 [Diaporthe ilicicola]|nr:hypothetical protein diail_6272 [Diaporthe ilicicola]